MSEKELREIVGSAVKAGVDAAMGSINERFKTVEDRVDRANRNRNIAIVTAFVCMIAAAFSVPYAVTSRQSADTANDALAEQQKTNTEVVCANARSTALAFRSPQVSAGGVAESTEHYLERMIAQRLTLIAAGKIKCPALPGFETFTYLRGKALAEIDRILQRRAPGRFKNLTHGLSPPAIVPAAGTSTPAGRSTETATGGSPASSPGSAPHQNSTSGGGGAGPVHHQPPGTKPPPHHPEHEPPATEVAGPPAPPAEEAGGGEAETPEEAKPPSNSGLIDPQGPLKPVCSLDPLLGTRLCGS